MKEKYLALMEKALSAYSNEQILNYFNYSYVNESNEQLQSFLEIGTCPWNENNKLLSVAIKAKEYEINAQRQNNFVFLLDVSGSMYSQDKLPLMINAFKILISSRQRVISPDLYSRT